MYLSVSLYISFFRFPLQRTSQLRVPITWAEGIQNNMKPGELQICKIISHYYYFVKSLGTMTYKRIVELLKCRPT